VILNAVLAVAGLLVPERLAEGWIQAQLRQLRQRDLDGDLTPETLRDELRNREGGHQLAQRLSEDSDPRVRAAVVETIAGWGTPARKRAPDDHRLPTQSLSNSEDTEALKRLLTDSDSTVRITALRAVCPLEEVRSFEQQVLDVLDLGPADERVIVAEHLAHWNGPAARRVFADEGQPKEVRLAVVRGADRYGWSLFIGNGSEFIPLMKRLATGPDAELRQAALHALGQGRDIPPE
jgi:hypothetical protein